jgi:cytochrome b
VSYKSSAVQNVHSIPLHFHHGILRTKEKFMTRNIRVWDLPTRVFHWSLAICVIGLIVTGNVGGDVMPWHFRLGYAVLSLLVWRIVWGLVGGYWSRFASFIYAPRSILNYLKGQGRPRDSVGHNPLGAFSVFGLLAFLLAQVGSGLLSDDEIAFSGPLTKLVTNATVSTATWYHKEVGKVIIFMLVLLHIAAILFYLFKKKENLVRPMVLGDKEVNADVPTSRDNIGTRLMALAVLGLSVLTVYTLVNLGG